MTQIKLQYFMPKEVLLSMIHTDLISHLEMCGILHVKRNVVWFTLLCSITSSGSLSGQTRSVAIGCKTTTIVYIFYNFVDLLTDYHSSKMLKYIISVGQMSISHPASIRVTVTRLSETHA